LRHGVDYVSGNKNLAVKIRDKTVDLKETPKTCMVVSRSNTDVNHEDSIGNFEFTVTPRVLFAPDGSLLSCTDKSALINALDKFANETLSLPKDELSSRSVTSVAILLILQMRVVHMYILSRNLPSSMEWLLSKK